MNKASEADFDDQEGHFTSLEGGPGDNGAGLGSHETKGDKENSFKSEEFQLDDADSLEKSGASDQNGKNPFIDPTVANYYRDLYESTKYECRGRFDPEFHWDPKEEKKLTRKLDVKVTLLACVLFVALQMDRGALGQAVSDNLLTDLNISTNVLNSSWSLFYCCFLAAELPSQLISKKLGCDIWIPTQITLWSIVSICQSRVRGKAGFLATRALLGLLEGGFIPDLVLWLSYFYTSSELSIRLSFFWFTLSLTQIISSLLAYGIFHIKGTSLHGWAWLFLIEGIFTLLIGISAFFLMPASIVQTKSPWNKKGWFTERQEKILVNKVLRDDPSKGSMHNRQGLTPKMLWQAMCDYHLWPIYIIGLVAYIPIDTLDTYMSLLLRSMGYSTLNVTLLLIPYYFTQGSSLVITTWLSERLHSIFNVCLLQPLWGIPLIAVLRWWNGALIEKWPTYAVLVLILCEPYIHAIMVSTCSRNSQSVKTRTVSASLYNMFVQAGSIVGSNIYRANDAPYYKRGNEVLFVLAVLMVPLLLGTKLWYVHINRKRSRIWDAMSKEEQEEYILTTKDTGSSKLNFRFAH
ncbi:DEKNAAC103969 [Brettanomyces naardenensis]|uniref:DEKNAAC103969 n=1 Tax=Brettanomyces naardenensis TaxID=13370 RepID=A0A448YPL9_BRENA|nr:DEKNAAC103969 [Brettanomyces naardenensis]